LSGDRATPAETQKRDRFFTVDHWTIAPCLSPAEGRSLHACCLLKGDCVSPFFHSAISQSFHNSDKLRCLATIKDSERTMPDLYVVIRNQDDVAMFSIEGELLTIFLLQDEILLHIQPVDLFLAEVLFFNALLIIKNVIVIRLRKFIAVSL